MLHKLKERLTNQKGFTLIELLAVIVILGILAAIAVPSIMGIINNSKADAHISNAQQLANSAKLYINEQKINIDTTGTTITLDQMITDGIMDNIKDPSAPSTATDKNYGTASSVLVKKTATSGPVVYYVLLESSAATPVKYIDQQNDTTPVDAFSLQRTDVSNY